MNKRVLAIFAIALLYIGSGCAVSSVQTARTNGAGNFQFAIEPGVIGVGSTNGIGGLFGPSFNLAGRYGVSDGVDIGARIGSVGYELQTKFMLTDPSDQESLAMALAPSATLLAFGGGSTGFVWFRAAIPFLLGIPVGGSEFTFGPRVTPQFLAGGAEGTSAGGFLLSGGGEISFAARVGDKFWVVPNFGVDVPLVGAAAGGGGSSTGGNFGVVFFGGGVGLLFGGRPRAVAAAPSSAPPPATMQ